jgi:hypothetical protein
MTSVRLVLCARDNSMPLRTCSGVAKIVPMATHKSTMAWCVLRLSNACGYTDPCTSHAPPLVSNRAPHHPSQVMTNRAAGERRSEFICVDYEHAGTSPTPEDHRQGFLYTTEIQIESDFHNRLPEPYHHNTEAGCAVCSAPGSVYTRWGATSCHNAANDVSLRTLYSGVVLGSHYQHPGSGANYLCFHEHPDAAPRGALGGASADANRDGGMLCMPTTHTASSPAPTRPPASPRAPPLRAGT